MGDERRKGQHTTLETSNDQSDRQIAGKNEYALIKGNTGPANVVIGGKAQMSTHVGDKYVHVEHQHGHHSNPGGTRSSAAAPAASTAQDKDGQATNFGTRNVFGMAAAQGAQVSVKYEGGLHMTGGNIPSEHLKEAIAGNNDSKLKVAVKFSDYSGKFEGRYRPDQTLFDVIVDILKEKKDNKFQHIKSKKGDIIDEDTKISTLQEKGILEYMTAVFN